MCSDVLKAGCFKLTERFTYISDATSIEEPSYMQNYAEVLLLCILLFQKLFMSEEF